MAEDTRAHSGLPQDLGALRTVMAADRTLMAWIRASLSMLSFGFTIYKVLETAAQSGHLARSNSPRQVGLFLAATGTGSMVLGVISYWTTLKDLRRAEEFRLGRPTLIVSFVMALAGLALFASIAARAV